jgi:hypothetical protein
VRSSVPVALPQGGSVLKEMTVYEPMSDGED